LWAGPASDLPVIGNLLVFPTESFCRWLAYTRLAKKYGMFYASFKHGARGGLHILRQVLVILCSTKATTLILRLASLCFLHTFYCLCHAELGIDYLFFGVW
jgi:hypothetical protein